MQNNLKQVFNRRLKQIYTDYLYCTLLLCLFIVPGCKSISPELEDMPAAAVQEQRLYELKNLSGRDCIAKLAKLGFDDFPQIHDSNAIIVRSTPELLNVANIAVELLDSNEEYVIANLGNASNVRNLPSNSQLALAMGDINIGTFSQPPQVSNKSRAIIDIFGGSIFAILPAQYSDELLVFLSEPEKLKEATEPVVASAAEQSVVVDQYIEPEDSSTYAQEMSSTNTTTGNIALPSASSTNVYAMSEMGQEEITPISNPSEADVPETIKIVFKPAGDIYQDPNTNRSRTQEPANGDEMLDMVLPETLKLVQLLDLAGEHLDLDYVYNPETIGNPTVTLKLHGNLQGQMRVKDMYSLLETVLKFNNLAMIRRENNMVTIVPSDKVLEADPQLVGDDGEILAVGDTVVTRVFALNYVNASSVSKLLENMKLGVAVTPMEDIQMVFVTCYAFRMSRIEELVNMIDRPGRVRECRFRRIQFITASSLTEKIRTLAKELQGITITSSAPAKEPTAAQPIKILTTGDTPSGGNVSVESRAKVPVFLDSDERTNRILMIGYEEELNLIEELIDVLDIVPVDQRTPRKYTIKNLKAAQALEKLQKMEVLKATGSENGAGADTNDNILTEDPIVIILESTNQLLIKATFGQHVRIQEYLNYIDVTQEDLRTLEIYPIEYVDAGTLSKKLAELELISAGSSASSLGPDKISSPDPNKASSGGASSLDVSTPQVVINESSNELFIKANPEQHSRIASIIKRLDKKLDKEEMLYKIYPLENSSPDHVANMLERLIHERSEDPEDKIQKPENTEIRMSIVPDPNTFSLLVYTSEKHHKLVSDLIESLDKRRPQVLIDVTLVEVTRNDSFEYDLNIIANASDSVIGNTVLSPIQTSTNRSLIEGGFNLLDSDGNPTGQTKAFYSEDKIQALLSMIRRKNYGRVLAKPKILVDDGRQGMISTIDQTTYSKETVQIPDQGSAITTSDFEIIEAKLQLQIIPHISEGNLLKLDVYMSREDFGTRPAEGAPPDKATSELITTVFVPDNKTVILGGLVKLNQSKGGSKIPILGDLPLIGFLFRSVDKSDVEKKLYVFLKANIVRPSDDGIELSDLENISKQHRDAFEESESEFQNYENIPGLEPIPMEPDKVLKDYK